MVSMAVIRKSVWVMALLVAAVSLFAPMAIAQEDHGGEGVHSGMSIGDGIRAAGIALGVAIAMVGSALGTARAQAAIGAGGTGALAEKPELFVNVLILVALPETIVVLGFVIGFLLLGNL